jgi:hypothetical protein
MNNDLTYYLDKTIDEVRHAKGSLDQLFIHTEAEQIAEQFYLTEQRYGIGLVFDWKEQLKAIHLHDGNDDKYRQFKGKLPCDLLFTDSIRVVDKKMGVPFSSDGGNENVPVLGRIKYWRKYKINGHYIHIEFHEECKSISMITIS